jgi:hypothetical protein
MMPRTIPEAETALFENIKNQVNGHVMRLIFMPIT